MVTHNMEEIARSVDRIILFENGGIVMEGTPAQVFSESARLSELGLSAPKVSMVAARLRAMGLPLSRGIYTIAQLRETYRLTVYSIGMANARGPLRFCAAAPACWVGLLNV
jgi:energy-coupling factor transport system ATP-binding protein